jgi:hypothetical protein
MVFGVHVFELAEWLGLLSKVAKWCKGLRSLDLPRKEEENISQMVDKWNK